MGCSYEEAKVRWYISNLLLTKDVSPKVMEIVVDWAQDKADIIGFDETEMDNAGKAENPEANLRRQEILLAGLGKHPSPFGTVTKSGVEKTLRKVGGLFRLSSVEQEVFGLFIRLGTQEYFLDLAEDLSGSPRRGRKKPLTFYAPHGEGQMMLDAIHAALGDREPVASPVMGLPITPHSQGAK